jgi:hypothetical protein
MFKTDLLLRVLAGLKLKTILKRISVICVALRTVIIAVIT